MNAIGAKPAAAIALPPARLHLGITGHRGSNPAFDANKAEIETAFARLFDMVDTATARQDERVATTRLHSLLAHGTDLLAVEQALGRSWEVVAPLPFGLRLNAAINAHPATPEDAAALLEGRACADRAAADFAAHIASIAHQAKLFELAEQDEAIEALFLSALSAPDDAAAAHAFATLVSERTAIAGRVMIEQSDLVIAVWDGITPAAVGGTRHTLEAALDEGVPVVWIDATAPARLRLLRLPEDLHAARDDVSEIEALIGTLVNPPSADRQARATRLHTEQWHPHSHRRFHAYRRIEQIFGGGGRFSSLVQRYETPEAIPEGSGAGLLAEAANLPGSDAAMREKIATQILQRFAWADGLSTYLSDAYRGGMVTNFVLSALAIIGGVAYLPVAGPAMKWPFALAEFLLLVAIVAITATGRKRRWHARWFETRRVAEYLRHAPILLLAGVMRSAGRWPRGSNTQWPEHYARLALRDIGLPRLRVTQAYLRRALDGLLHRHVQAQHAYHTAKAKRLARVHHNLDKCSELLFALAIVAAAAYLLLAGAGRAGLIPAHIALDASKAFTFLGVAFPALGSTFAGIRYFGDFERFAAISEVTSGKLAVLLERIELLSASPGTSLTYGHVAGLAHALDDTVIDEIENWQAVFAGKQIAVPV